MEYPHLIDSVVDSVCRALPWHCQRRRGTLGPARTFLAVMQRIGFGMRGYRRLGREIDQHVQQRLGWDVHGIPSAAAICKSRRKSTIAHAQQAFAACANVVGAQSPDAPSMTYAGLPVYAIDATHVACTDSPEIAEHFGRPTNGHGGSYRPQATLTAPWNVSYNRPLAYHLTPYRTNERQEALGLIPHVPADALLIGDRGYPSHAISQALDQQRCRFLLRVQRGGTFGVVRDFVDSQKLIRVVTIRRKGDPNSITLRLVRAPLPTGGEAVLITNLIDEQRYPHAELANLYRARWQIETAFREMKVTHVLEQSNVSHVAGVHQHVAAVMCYPLVASWVEAIVRAEKHVAEPPDNGEEEPYTFNRLMILDTVMALMRTDPTDQQRIDHILNQSIAEIWRYRQKGMPGRKYPRPRKRN